MATKQMKQAAAKQMKQAAMAAKPKMGGSDTAKLAQAQKALMKQASTARAQQSPSKGGMGPKGGMGAPGGMPARPGPAGMGPKGGMGAPGGMPARSGPLPTQQRAQQAQMPSPMQGLGAAAAGRGMFKKGGDVKKMASGGLAAGHKSADGVASKGKTKAKMVTMGGSKGMKYGGKC